MSKGSIVISGINEITASLSEFIDDLPGVALVSIDEGLDIVERQMRVNANTMFNKGYSIGVMQESISHTAIIGKSGDALGDVGVYHMSNKTGTYPNGKKAPRVNAPLLAFFYEGGIQSHSLRAGSRTERRPTKSNPRGRPAVNQVEPIHNGSPPIPFLTNAFIAYGNKLTEVAIKNFNQLGDKL